MCTVITEQVSNDVEERPKNKGARRTARICQECVIYVATGYPPTRIKNINPSLNISRGINNCSPVRSSRKPPRKTHYYKHSSRASAHCSVPTAQAVSVVRYYNITPAPGYD